MDTHSQSFLGRAEQLKPDVTFALKGTSVATLTEFATISVCNIKAGSVDICADAVRGQGAAYKSIVSRPEGCNGSDPVLVFNAAVMSFVDVYMGKYMFSRSYSWSDGKSQLVEYFRCLDASATKRLELAETLSGLAIACRLGSGVSGDVYSCSVISEDAMSTSLAGNNVAVKLYKASLGCGGADRECNSLGDSESEGPLRGNSDGCNPVVRDDAWLRGREPSPSAAVAVRTAAKGRSEGAFPTPRAWLSPKGSDSFRSESMNCDCWWNVDPKSSLGLRPCYIVWIPDLLWQ